MTDEEHERGKDHPHYSTGYVDIEQVEEEVREEYEGAVEKNKRVGKRLYRRALDYIKNKGRVEHGWRLYFYAKLKTDLPKNSMKKMREAIGIWRRQHGDEFRD